MGYLNRSRASVTQASWLRSACCWAGDGANIVEGSQVTSLPGVFLGNGLAWSAQDAPLAAMCRLILRDEAGHIAFHRERLVLCARLERASYGWSSEGPSQPRARYTVHARLAVACSRCMGTKMYFIVLLVGQAAMPWTYGQPGRGRICTLPSLTCSSVSAGTSPGCLLPPDQGDSSCPILEAIEPTMSGSWTDR